MSNDEYLMENLHKLAEAHFGRSGNASPDVEKEIDQQAKNRRKTGRYTLEEAAYYVEKKANARAKAILTKLKEAVIDDSLTVYEPGGDEKYRIDPPRGWHEEVYWDDLNKWLKKYEPRIGKIFPDPKSFTINKTFTEDQNKDLHQDTNNWKTIVQLEAARRLKTLRKGGASPSKYSIRNDLAKWCIKTDLKTTTGIYPDPEYIYRHVLRDWDPPSD